ncbi:MAG: hypothetical protein NT047_15735 [Deltaproteobacteria bacterium]|nr:hypothetical protein [Deltaproteobacteria bacterium]
MHTRVEALAKARTVLLEEIRGRFPRYTDFINPEQATVDKVQGSLRANEALFVIYPAEKETYIWSVPQKGNIRLATSTLGRKDLARIVNRLCRSLAPNQTILGDIPEFDLRSAHELYNELLNPVEEGWGQAKDLLIVAPGPLGPDPLLRTANLPGGPQGG